MPPTKREAEAAYEPPTIVIHGECSIARLAAALEALVRNTNDPFWLGVVEHDVGTMVVNVPTSVALRERLLPVATELDSSQRSADVLRRLSAARPEADLVLLEAGAEVDSGWLDRLRTVAYFDSVCASASAVRAPTSAQSSPQASTTLIAAAEQEVAPPVIDAPIWGAVYVRRDALNLALAGDADDGASFLNDLSRALSVPGLVNRLAYDATVWVEQAEVGVGVAERESSDGAVARALDIAATAGRLVTVMIDARCLDHPVSGTTVHITSLAKALADTGEAEVSVLAPSEIHPSNQSHVAALGDLVDFVHTDSTRGARPMIFHRPFQVALDFDLADCLSIGRRFVLTHQDMILDRTPQYFPSEQAWRAFRRVTAAAFASADHVGFFSEHAARDALADGVLERHKTSVVPLGVDHLDASSPQENSDEELGLEALAETAFILVLGHAYLHKNRLFALRLLECLRTRHGWSGKLVLAGADPVVGSSVPQERRFLLDRPLLSQHVVDLGPVSEEQKRWLFRRSGVVLFPSLYEGFGLIPFEAAAHGTPCVYGWRSSLREFLPEEGAVLEGWDVDACASDVLELLAGGARAGALVAAIRRAAGELTWARTAERYVDVYKRALHAPVRVLVSGAAGDAEGRGDFHFGLSGRERRVVDIYRRRRVFRGIIDGVISVGARATTAGRKLRRRADMTPAPVPAAPRRSDDETGG